MITSSSTDSTTRTGDGCNYFFDRHTASDRLVWERQAEISLVRCGGDVEIVNERIWIEEMMERNQEDTPEVNS